MPIDLIHPGPTQARRRFDAGRLQELAESIRESGVVQPVVLRGDGRGGYELLAGERRWRAAQLAGLHELPALIRDDLDEAQARVLGLVENLQRESLSPMETAAGLSELCRAPGMTHEAVAARIGKSRVYVTNFLRLLMLEAAVQRLVDDGSLSLGHAKVLAGLPADRQLMLARQAVAEGWSVRSLERRTATQGMASGSKRRGDSDLQRLEREIAEHLGYPASIDADPSGRGELRVRFHSLDELQGLLDRIGYRSR